MSWTRPYLDSFCRLIFTDPPLVNSRWTSGWDGYWVIRPTPALGRTSHITVILGQYYKVLFLSMILKETNFCCLIVPVFQNSKWIVPYSEVFWLCESERCRCCKLVCVKNVSSNMVWSGWILSAKNMLQAALSTYYVASTSQCTEINFVWWACISLWYAHW